MKLSTVIVALSLIAATPVLAEGTAAQRAACTGDAFRLCLSEIPNVAGVTACLRRERTNISSACRMVIDAGNGGVQPVLSKASALTRN
ncbi:hypothetical protein [Methylobacterium sp. WL7]|uniref:hypothetical protein n=1 Tax=Methylobacterium sp. WL7 TaxID=2603900 RepID=UPI0011C90D66|nr:hypothetical protein [Methylobacterium sp. WL7]TXN42932.1 hypothetical protein FV233_20570 [Methylobacterium sp. WL7]